MKITLIDNAKKKKIIECVLNLGIKKIHYLLLKSGHERIRAFSGDLSNDELLKIWSILPIEGVGLYFGKEQIDRKNGRREVRLSLDALHVLKEQISGNIVFLNEEQEEKWFAGKDIDLNEINLRGFVAVFSEQDKDIIGTGKISADGKILFNYLPKERCRRGN